MESESHQPLAPQFSIAGGLLIVAAIASALGLGTLWSDRGGLSLAIPAAVIPFSFVAEFALRNKKCIHAPLKMSVVGWRFFAIVVASILPAIAGWVGLANQGEWWSPCPYLMFIAGAYQEPWLAEWPYVLYAIPSLAFLVITIPSAFSSKQERLPIRSLTILLVASITTVFWFCSSTSAAFKYQSTSYIIGAIAANSICIFALWLSWGMLRQRFNFALRITWNLAMVAWLFWLAYPWLGEYI